MSKNTKVVVVGMLLFSIFGLMIETTFTGLGAWWSGSFKGGVSLLMIPVYSLSYLLGIVAIKYLADTVVFEMKFRIPIIVVTVYSVEWFFGALYQKMGLLPWYYDHGWASAFSNGNITLYFLPAWVFFGLIVIPAMKIISKLSPVLLQELGDTSNR